MLDEELLKILACPACKSPLAQESPAAGDDVDEWLCCETCQRRYPVRKGIPILLIDEAKPLAR